MRLNLSDENWGHSITCQRATKDFEEVLGQPLGDYLEEEDVNKVHFVKFNCEGAEFPIILNTPPEILQRFETMLVLYHLDLAEGYTLEQLEDYLRSSGFKTERRDQRTKRGWLVVTREN